MAAPITDFLVSEAAVLVDQPSLTADRRVLIVSYSFTQQTRALVRQFAGGLASAGVGVVQERLEPIRPYAFPFPSDFQLAIAMVATLFGRRMPIQPVSERCRGEWDRIILAGPTWSYHPSGPVLAFLDRDARIVCKGQTVIPLISCRAYWQWHARILQRQLVRCGATVESPLVFPHPVNEPWRSLGLLLKLRGKIARKRHAWLRRHYPRYGHNQAQRHQAWEQGRQLGLRLLNASSRQVGQPGGTCREIAPTPGRAL